MAMGYPGSEEKGRLTEAETSRPRLPNRKGSATRRLGMPWINEGIITFSKAVNSTNRWWNWKMNPIFSFRNLASPLSSSRNTS